MSEFLGKRRFSQVVTLSTCEYLMAGAPYAEAMRSYAGTIAEQARDAKKSGFL
ncbi:MAG: hypothetical protein J5963_06000 [Schwartzia sp.]|nr:hypothetical protein [Schwartzia sp. (in: firmicutes)]